MNYRTSIIFVLFVYACSTGYLVASAIHGSVEHCDWAALVVVISTILLACNLKEVLKIVEQFLDD